MRRIAAEGAAFDPALHEAVMELDDPAQATSGTVLAGRWKHGYTINDRLLRPARVVVAKRHVRAQPDFDDSDLGVEWKSHSVNQL